MEAYQHIRLTLKLRIVDYQKTEKYALQGSMVPGNLGSKQVIALML